MDHVRKTASHRAENLECWSFSKALLHIMIMIRLATLDLRVYEVAGNIFDSIEYLCNLMNKIKYLIFFLMDFSFTYIIQIGFCYWHIERFFMLIYKEQNKIAPRIKIPFITFLMPSPKKWYYKEKCNKQGISIFSCSLSYFFFIKF